MSGIVNSTGAVSGIIGTTVGTPAGGGLTSQQVFTSGTSTWTKPSDITTIKVLVTAGGAGGGGGTSDYNTAGGGGGGGTAIKILDVTNISTCTVIVGSAGGAGSAQGNGTDGNTSSFAHASGTGTFTTVSASGGTRGEVPNSGNNNLGGVGSNGDINVYGGHGGSQGAHASSDEVGGGFGGSSYWGGGGKCASAWQTLASRSGLSFGSGGGGGQHGTGNSANGADGKAGIVVVEEYT